MQKVMVNLKNCYGIGEVSCEFDFNRAPVHAVYAPNGFMKTSFAIFPDGGVSRLRILGTPTETTPADDDPWLQRVNALSVDGFRRYGLQHQLCGLP